MADAGGAKRKRKKRLYTLTEVAKKTGISMPTLQRYKKLHQRRIPAVGKGRRQRYPEEALKVFRQLKAEGVGRRGRRKKGAAGGRKAAGKKRVGEGLLTLSEIQKRTGISYPTLSRYVKLYLDRIPHRGRGRARRYPAEAVEVFRQLRRESRRGRKKAALSGAEVRTAAGTDKELARRIREIEKAQQKIEQQLNSVVETLKKPLRVTIRSD